MRTFAQARAFLLAHRTDDRTVVSGRGVRFRLASARDVQLCFSELDLSDQEAESALIPDERDTKSC